jgi:hypothetical protein
MIKPLMGDAARRYTGVWRSPDPLEGPWLREMFGPYLAREVTDPAHEFVGDHVILFEIFANAQDPEYFEKFRGLDAFLVDLSDEHYEFVPEMYTNFRGVIRPYGSDVFLPEAIYTLPLGYPSSLFPQPSLKPATERQFFWSFTGQLAKSSRPDMARQLSRIEPHLLFSTDEEKNAPMWRRTSDGAKQRYSPEENSAIMADTVFAPCPMGNSNLECFRVYEALELGCIPLVESRLTLDYFHSKYGAHPMPTFRSWQKARRFLEGIIDKPEQIDRLQRDCIAWWHTHKARNREELGAFLARRSAITTQPTLEQLFKPRHAWPAFAHLELLRHHDLRALGRRIHKMAKRVATTGGLRVHHRPADH